MNSIWFGKLFKVVLVVGVLTQGGAAVPELKDPQHVRSARQGAQGPLAVQNSKNFQGLQDARSSPQNLQGSESSQASQAPPDQQQRVRFEDEKSAQLQKLVEQMYLAEAQVQLEANEISKSQAVVSTSQQNLEEATNNVRIITSGLHMAQQAVAQAALRAQTAQLQLAAHDQLLFAARQKVDAISAQLIGLQAEVGIKVDASDEADLQEVLQRMNQPLQGKDVPSPVPDLVSKSENARPCENSNKQAPINFKVTMNSQMQPGQMQRRPQRLALFSSLNQYRDKLIQDYFDSQKTQVKKK